MSWANKVLNFARKREAKGKGVGGERRNDQASEDLLE